MRHHLSHAIFAFPLLLSCAASTERDRPVPVPAEHKEYWYNGEAEITSFELSQARYGEMRTGNAVMIFVTEDFSTREFVKTDEPDENAVSVLKLNFTRDFVTGIYPYSIMTSSFIPFSGNRHALKVSCSVQEWCGHVYMELLRKKQYSLSVSSYFEDESAESTLPVSWLEDELWSRIRLNPEGLPTGTHKVIPSFSYSRLMHIDMKAYDCEITLHRQDSTETVLSLFYEELQRRLSITFETAFPHAIIRWEEQYPDGFGENKPVLTTTGERIKMIRSAYWTKNKNSDRDLRRELGIE